MYGLGTIINVAAIIAGGIIGSLVGGRLKERFREIITMSIGLAVIFMGAGGAVSKMLVPSGTAFETTGTMMVIFSLVLGGILGEIINIDHHVDRFGTWLRNKTKNTGDAKFVDGFVNASLTVCIGAMAIMGALMDGLNKDPSILITKSILDFVSVLIMSASMGKGCIFSAIPVGILQGLVTVFAKLLAPVMNDAAMNNLSLVGSILIFCVGVNLMFQGKFRIKIANLLPAIIFAVVAAYIPFLN
ncbi:MAG: DUF554 domain-containing protein [Lachnospiraceae bacterium]|jgi:uncharacterized membrane protein YqgA involved in biofilm formation